MAVGSSRFAPTIVLVVAILAWVLGFWYHNQPTTQNASATKLPFKGQFPLARISGEEFEDVVGMPPFVIPKVRRDYGVFLLLNTLAPEFNCPSCKIFEREFSRIAETVSSDKRIERKAHFGTMELKNNRDLFIKIKAEQVPTLIYLPPTINFTPLQYEKAIRAFDMKMGVAPGSIEKFIEDNGGITIEVVNDSKRGTILFAIGILAITIAAMKLYLGLDITKIAYHSNFWALLSIMFVLVMTSGFMWVRIRGAPYATGGRDGRMQFFAGTLQSQLGAESHLIIILNGISALSVIILSSGVHKISHKLSRQVAIFICTTILMCAFSAEVAIFRRKMGGYPFRLLFA